MSEGRKRRQSSTLLSTPARIASAPIKQTSNRLGELESEVTRLKQELDQASVSGKSHLNLPSGQVEVTLKHVDVAQCTVWAQNSRDFENLSVNDVQDIHESIRAVGVTDPIVVRERAGQWEVVDGSRRLFCANLEQHQTIPALIGDFADSDCYYLTVARNNSARLSPHETGRFVVQAMESGSFNSKHEIARHCGISDRNLGRCERVYQLPESVKQLFGDPRLIPASAGDELCQSVEQLKSSVGEDGLDELLSKLVPFKLDPEGEVSLQDVYRFTNRLAKKLSKPVEPKNRISGKTGRAVTYKNKETGKEVFKSTRTKTGGLKIELLVDDEEKQQALFAYVMKLTGAEEV